MTDWLAAAEHAVAVAGGVVTCASLVCARLPTPDPATRWGRVYRAIEIAALIVGRAKETGLIAEMKPPPRS